MVPGAGIEPARYFYRGIFLPTTALTATHLRICGLDFIFAISSVNDLGRSRQVSTLSQGQEMKLRKYTEPELRKAVSTSTSLRQVLLALRVSPSGGNYTILKKRPSTILI